jgi:hypothetical protein
VTRNDQHVEELARNQGVSIGAARALLAKLRAQAGADEFYVFWTAKKSAGAAGPRRARTLLAFVTPDAALAFAQRNRLNADDLPRLRRLALFQLAQAALREPSIAALLFVAEGGDPALTAGNLPAGARIEREELLRWLHEPSQERADSQQV